MRNKILIGLVIILVLALFVEAAYLLQVKYDKAKHQNSLNKTLSYKPFIWKEDDFLDPLNSLLSNGSLFNLNDNLFETFTPSTDIKETDKCYVIRMDLPGMEKEKINIKLEDNVLVISGEENIKQQGRQSFKTFKKVIPLPQEIKTDAVTTEYKDGTLIVILPKANPEKPYSEPKVKIQV